MMAKGAVYSSVVVCLSVMPSAAYAEQSPLLATFAKLLATSEHTVNSWDTKAVILISLAVAVGMLGVITGILQGLNGAWKTAATIAVGAIVSLITVVNNTAFTADYRTFLQSAATGHAELEKMEVALAELREGSGNARECQIEFLKHYDTITKLKKIIVGKPDDIVGKPDEKEVRPNTRSYLVPTVIAETRPAEGAPKWAQAKPADTDTSRFFVGSGEASELESAREVSLRDARDQAVRELARSVTTSVTNLDAVEELRLREVVARLGEVADTAFAVYKERGRVRYWTLLRLNPRFFDEKLLAVGEPSRTGPRGRVLHSVNPQYFNESKTLRVEYANVVIEDNGKATFSFQAAATIRARFPGDTGPAVSLMFVDKEKRPLGPGRDVARATVDTCGGYENHEAMLSDREFPREVLARAEAFTLQIPANTTPVVCDRRTKSIPPPSF